MWQKREMDKLDYIQIKQPLGYKQYCQESEKQPIEWEKVFANHMSDKELASRIYKEHKIQ